MSINYQGPHPVDVPITDLDDAEDDIIYRENLGNNSGYQDNSQNFLNSMDYEHQDSQQGFMGKIRNYFNNPRLSGGRYTSVASTDSFEIDDDDDDDEVANRFAFDIRDYKIKRLNDKLNKTIAILVFGLLLVIVIIFFNKSWFTSSSVEEDKEYASMASQHKKVKQVLSNTTHDFYPTTIIVSLDGFHPHYINPYLTPSLHNMMINDYGAPYMIPSFPSSTFPNHWTLITGLHPSEHGIVGNTFFDPVLKKQFVNTDPKVGGIDPDFWQGGEPIWQTAFKQGVNSAVHMWPGSEVPGIGIDNGPMEVDRYNGSELLSSKVARVMGWLDRDDINKRPELILTYVPTIDQFGHKFGISGKNLTDALKYVDDFVDLMQMELKNRNLRDVVNLVIVSDHGMAPTSNDRLLFLDDVIDLQKIEHIDGWPLFGLRPYKKHSLDDIYKELKEKFATLSQDLQKHYHIYKLEDFPKQYNFGGSKNEHKFNYRLAPIWIVPDVGYSITTHKQHEENNFDYTPKGVHGYNNTEVLMRALFLGSGPYFDKELGSITNTKIKPFQNIEVYNLLCDSLNIAPAPNNGSGSPQTSISNLVSTKNLLPEDWSDSLGYPNVPFEIDHIVKDATYDLLWKKPADRAQPTTISVSTNEKPMESLASQESSLSNIATEKLPKPSDFTTTSHDEKPEPTSNPLNNLIGEIEGAIDDVGDALNDVFEDAGDGLNDAVDGLNDAAGTTSEKVHNWMGKLFGDASDDDKS